MNLEGTQHPTAPPVADAHRRPIPGRKHGASIALAKLCVRAGVTANAVSIIGLVAATIAGASLAATSWSAPAAASIPHWALYLAAALLIPVRLVCNMIDGLIAVEMEERSRTGELYNEIPDRLADVAVLVGAGYAAGSLPWLGYVAGMLALLITYIRALGRGLGFPSDYRGPMAKQQRMVLVMLASAALAVLSLGRWEVPYLTPSLAGVIPASDGSATPPLSSPGLLAWTLGLIIAGCVATGVRRVSLLSRRLREQAASP